MEAQPLEISHRLRVPVDRVWSAWSEPAVLCRWDPDRIDGEMSEGAELVMHWDSFGLSLPMTVVERQPGARLRLRTRRPDGQAHDLLVSLREEDDGCRVTLGFTGAMSEDERAGTAAGWHSQLRILERFLQRDPSGPRHSFSALGPAVTSLERAFMHFATPFWLAASPPHLEGEGQGFEILSHEGVSMSGELVSFVRDRELALWVDELDGIARFRALPLAGGVARLLGVQIVRWGEAAMAHPIQESFRMGVDRLVSEVGGPVGTA